MSRKQAYILLRMGSWVPIADLAEAWAYDPKFFVALVDTLKLNQLVEVEEIDDVLCLRTKFGDCLSDFLFSKPKKKKATE